MGRAGYTEFRTLPDVGFFELLAEVFKTDIKNVLGMSCHARPLQSLTGKHCGDISLAEPNELFCSTVSRQVVRQQHSQKRSDVFTACFGCGEPRNQTDINGP